MYKTIVVTYTGKQIDLLNPKVKDIDIVDIAHSLAMTCRFNGHSRKFYSVAEHCVRASYFGTTIPMRQYLLLHDAAEAYLGDFISPVKHLKSIENGIRSVETNFLEVILSRFNIRLNSKPVKIIDSGLLIAEMKSLFPLGLINPCVPLSSTPLKVKIKSWSMRKAEKRYLKRAKELLLI